MRQLLTSYSILSVWYRRGGVGRIVNELCVTWVSGVGSLQCWRFPCDGHRACVSTIYEAAWNTRGVAEEHVCGNKMSRSEVSFTTRRSASRIALAALVPQEHQRVCRASCLVGQVAGKYTQPLLSIPVDSSSQGPPSWAFLDRPSGVPLSLSKVSLSHGFLSILPPSSSHHCGSFLSLPLPPPLTVSSLLSH